MLNTQKILPNTLNSQASYNINYSKINKCMNNDDKWCVPEPQLYNLSNIYNCDGLMDQKPGNFGESLVFGETNGNIFMDYNMENNENTNNGLHVNNNSCKHLYSNLFNANNITNNMMTNNTIKNNTMEIIPSQNLYANSGRGCQKPMISRESMAFGEINEYMDINKFEYMESIKKLIFFNNNNIIHGEFTIYQFIKYLIMNIDTHNKFLKHASVFNHHNIISFMENNICITTLNTSSNLCIKLLSTSIMENIDFLFAFNNIIYSYKTNELLNDLENIEDVLQGKIIVVFDQFLYLLINHTLKIILAYSIKNKKNEQYDKISSLLIYRMSKLVHNQLSTHIQMNIQITKYLNMIREIHDDFSKKISIELGQKKKKKCVNIYPDSSIKILSSAENSSSNTDSISDDENIKSKYKNDNMSFDNNVSFSSSNIFDKNNLESSLSFIDMDEKKNKNEIKKKIETRDDNKLFEQNDNTESIKNKINMDLDKILSEIT